MGINEHVKLHAKHQKKLGGTRAAMFVYAMVGLENMAFISTAISLVTYFFGYMNFSLTKSATTLTNYLGTAFLLSLFGGFISDTYLSRFTTGILFASFEVLGYALLAVQAHFQQLRPIPCNPTQVGPCQQVDSGQEAILFTGLYLIAFGSGGVKAALPSLGADQFDERDPKEAESLASFFNWFLFSVTTGAIFGVTFVVWISSNQGWDWALGVCSLAVFVAALFLLMGKSMFRNYVPKESAILRILQVFVVAIRNRKIPLPENTEELHDIRDKEIGVTSDILQRTDQFRCLDRAAIVSNAVIASEFLPSGSWKLCTVSQVEETKILIRMLPIILSTIFMNTCLAQLQTFTIQQSTTMDRDLLGFKVPGPSIPVIPLVFMAILIPLYDRFFVPFVRMYTGIPTGIRHLQRIGVGLVLSAISMAVAGIVETHRKSVALDNNMVDSPGPLPMSVFWLGYQYAIFGVADMFTLVGLLEFFYEESSPSMKSLGTAISWCSMAFGYFMSSIVVEVVNKVITGDVKIQARHQKRLGGTRAAMFAYAMIGLENMAFIAMAISLVTYFYGYMNFSLTKSATTLTNFSGTAYLLSLFGGFISDTYLSRFKTCILFASFEVVGYALLAVQARFQQLRPILCNASLGNVCEQAESGHEAILFTGLYLIAFGTGGIKAALPSLGAEQFDQSDPKEAESLASFFNWFLFSVTTGAVFGVTFVVWISSNQGWDWGFGICSVAVLVSALFLLMGKSMYRNYVPKGSPISRILQVFVVAIGNRNIPIPEMTNELHEIHDKEAGVVSEILQRTEHFRCLDRAAIISSGLDASEFSPSGSWKLCTVTQVEETKILIRMLPIILSTIFMNTCLAQLQTFTIQQSTTMDRNLLGFTVPGPSIPVIPLAFMCILIPIYDRYLVPFVRKFTGIPTGIKHLQRIGVGLVLSAISMAVAGIVETHRKSVAIDNNMVDSPDPLPLTVFWLGFQYAIFGVADMFTLIGLLEFFYEESSSGMKSLGTAISWCSMAFGYYLSSIVVQVVNKVSGGWLASNNLNRDKLNYFYWLLAGLSIVNFGAYLMCASWYKYKKVGVKHIDAGSNVDDVSKGKIQMSKA
nr:protein NRT1/ PTR FAMILY 4.5-like [Tanacetum cinerariifolium]